MGVKEDGRGGRTRRDRGRTEGSWWKGLASAGVVTGSWAVSYTGRSNPLPASVYPGGAKQTPQASVPSLPPILLSLSELELEANMFL